MIHNFFMIHKFFFMIHKFDLRKFLFCLNKSTDFSPEKSVGAELGLATWCGTVSLVLSEYNNQKFVS